MFLSPRKHVLELVVIEVIVESEALVSADDLGTVSWEKCILESTLNNSFHLRAASWGCFKNLKILEWITALGRHKLSFLLILYRQEIYRTTEVLVVIEVIAENHAN